MKYILTFLSRDQPMKWYPEWGFAATTDSPDLATATRFDTLEEAATAYERTRASYDGLPGLRIQGIEEIPGETKLEEVPLSTAHKTTDDLKYAVVALLPYYGGQYLKKDGCVTDDINEAQLYDSLGYANMTEKPAVFLGSYIVGVREVTAPPTFRVVPLG